MSKEKVIRFLSCYIIAYIFLPVVFRNIPIPMIGEFSYLFFIVGLLFMKPEIFTSKQLLIFYFFVFIYFLLAPSTGPESNWMERRALNLFIGIALYSYYFNFSQDFKGMRIVFWFSFFVITCL